MKRVTLALLLLFSITTIAQQGINYKALIKDGAGAVVASQMITVQFQILQGAAMTNVYEETHTPTTDANGLIIVNIGEGTPVSGVFADIDWGSDNHFLNTQIDTGGGLQDMGTTGFKTVPYALHAKTVTQPTYILNTFYASLGGYVIEINADGTHGLVVAMQDQGFSSWYEANDLLSNAANHDVNGAKFKDWRLPTKRELNLMYVQRTNIGAAGLCWSSTESNSSFAWTQNFFNGFQFNGYKFDSNVVRAVRAF